AVCDRAQGGWKALRVRKLKSADAWENGGKSSTEADSLQLRPLIGTITAFDRDGGYINSNTYFSCHSLLEGYEPMKGDWVQAEYFINPCNYATQAKSVAPLRYCRLDSFVQVHVTSLNGNMGVVDDSVFFSLDSVLLPANYQPLQGHLVNVVMVEVVSLFTAGGLCAWRPAIRGISHSFWVKTTVANQEVLQENCSVSEAAIGSCAKEEDDEMLKEATHFHGVRREESKLDIPPGERLSVAVAFALSCLLLHFSSFTIGRRLEVTVRSKVEELLKPSFPYSPLMPKPFPPVSAYDHLTKRKLPNFLPNYPVPQGLRNCVEMHRDVLVVQLLSPSNLHSRFSTLLWLEELHAEQEVKEFTIYGASLRKGATYLHLEVLGLAEHRPSDRVVLKKPQSDGVVVKYISYVTEINNEDVSLKVHSEFQRSYLGEPLDVEFSYNRLTARHCHFALEQAKQFRDVLFPSRVIVQMENAVQTAAQQGHFFNPYLNPSQKEAVKRILVGECTGKTITLIEAILQVYIHTKRYSMKSELVCTPSNSAADLICIRLHHSGFLGAASLARVNASCRHEESIPEVLRPYSSAGEDVRHAAFHRIVVSTCASASMFNKIGLQVGHFSHLFLDEAGQATEPESLIPISLMSEKDGQIVLAGDPCQLGPVVKSKLAAAFGLGVSLLERLMANPLYSRHDWGYNPKLVTKLLYNYRSHEALIALSSKLFYHGELCVKAPRAVVDSLCQWKTLPKKGFPLLFHGVRGTEMREGNNPSWFNPVEAVQVMLYCCQLAKKLYNPVDTSDIGIITPYRKQCEKIRLLGKVGLSDIKVGSVEEFQGQEFLVIILSTVRSNESVDNNDLQSVLGFLANPKRFNVAITRPKALLLIVGNPHILIKDACFRALLQYCFINGGYLGCDPPPSLRDSQRHV
uniref:RNA helicase n=1 Tax=Sphaeramia orbicularis TaxID=375764 RepID=A0A672ZU77_9TELE